MSWYTPPEIFENMMNMGEKKTKNSKSQTFWLGILGGAYIALGSLLYTVAITGTAETLGYGASKILGGTVFSLGLILVVIAGAELFTGNILIFADAMGKRVSWKSVFLNWIIVYGTNFLGAITVIIFVYYGGIYQSLDSGALTEIGKSAWNVALKKVHLTSTEIFFRGIMANWLVCLGVYIGLAGKDIVSKIVGILFPVMAFVAIGLEHCIANMFLLPVAYVLNPSSADLTLSLIGHNILFATAGNIMGGLLVGVLYFGIYQKSGETSRKNEEPSSLLL